MTSKRDGFSVAGRNGACVCVLARICEIESTECLLLTFLWGLQPSCSAFWSVTFSTELSICACIQIVSVSQVFVFCTVPDVMTGRD